MYDNEETSTDGYSAEEWPERCAYWLAKHNSERPRRKRREREKSALILTGQGLSICVEKGRLVIRDGNTHYPSETRQFEFFKGSLDLPPRIVLLDGSGSITLDAMDWIAEQGVPLVRVRWNGQFFSLLTAGGQAADPDKFAWQIEARKSEAERVAFFIPLITEKLANALATLQDFVPPSSERDTAEKKTAAYLDKLRTNPPSSLKALLGMEAQAASVYFMAWRALEMKWKASKRYPIPKEWHHFQARTSDAISSKGGANIFATHPINAMLNYAYGVLLAQVQLQAIADGYDPMLGVVHTRSRSSYGPPRPGFALDLMEPHRPVVDRVVLGLVRDEVFSGADFLLQSDGVVRLGPELARRVASTLSAQGGFEAPRV